MDSESQIHDGYKVWRENFEKEFAETIQVKESIETHISPSGKFVLETSDYEKKPKSWNYSRGIVRDQTRGIVIADIKRNYGIFWHAWVVHPNGHEYLLCGEDYQGYNVIDLSTGENAVYFPDAGFKGGGFCWVVVSPSPDGLTLAIDGCYWACPYDMVFVDFSDPTVIPLRELARFGDLDTTVGWQDERTFSFTQYDESENKRLINWIR
ncbi:MAG TPA: hypothetical protein VNW52_03865 [Burkholderiaceae bacterium]|jgi:hypothetical protein|nr:hypothetical protein [Burkholderiaceae bacterium]